MKDLLPPQVLENLQLLRSKVSETVLQRGILIPHPREEYEMLEERLLEALELKEERVTKCGHFLGRVSGSSRESISDSGLGSSAEGSEDGDRCALCRCHIQCIAGKKQEWSVKVFAANGLMRTAAWAAAWSEMESVDVEILPWISEEDRRKLDQRMEEEEEERQVRERLEGEGSVLQKRLSMEEIDADEIEEILEARERSTDCGAFATSSALTATTQGSPQPRSKSSSGAGPSDLPPIYRTSQVPVSALLRNYLFLLVQDRRNVAVFFIAILAMFFAVRSLSSSTNTAVVPFDAMTFDVLPEASQKTRAATMESPKEDIPSVLGSADETVSDMLELEGQAAASQSELVQPVHDFRQQDVEEEGQEMLE